MLSVVAVALISSFGVAQAQEDCPVGTLDDLYCDLSGDLLADAPTDAADLINPDTQIFAYTPVEYPAVYKEAWSDFLDYMEEVTGKEVIFFPVQSNAAQIEIMFSGRLHIAGFNTGSNRQPRLTRRHRAKLCGLLSRCVRNVAWLQVSLILAVILVAVVIGEFISAKVRGAII